MLTHSNYVGVRIRVSRVDTFKLRGRKNPCGHLHNNLCASGTQRGQRKSASVRPTRLS